MNTNPDTFVQSLEFAHHQRQDFEGWLAKTVRYTEGIIEETLAMMARAEKKGDRGQRAFPTVRANLQLLNQLLQDIREEGYQSSCTLSAHLQDVKYAILRQQGEDTVI